MPYVYKRTLTCDHAQCGTGNSTDFPVLVRVTNATLALVSSGGHVNNTTTSNGQTVPADLAFFSDAVLSSALSWEVESYDGTTGTLVAWVKIPTLSHTADTVFYLAYSDPSVTTFQGDVNATWNSAFKGVWHLPNGTTLAAKDSTANAHDGAISGPTASVGNTDGAASFAGTGTNKLSFGASADWNFAGSFTASCWIKVSVDADGFILGINNGVGTFAFELTQTHFGGDGLFWGVNGASVQAHYFVSVADGQWHHVVGTWDSGTQVPTVYLDAASVASGTALGAFAGSSSIALTAGNDAGNVGVFGLYAGLLDEVKVSNVLRSTDWITSEYNNQVPASTFLTLGSEDVTAYTLSAGSGAYTVTGTRTRLIWSGAATGVFPQAMAIAIMGL
jgi:hypothetical protein